MLPRPHLPRFCSFLTYLLLQFVIDTSLLMGLKTCRIAKGFDHQSDGVACLNHGSNQHFSSMSLGTEEWMDFWDDASSGGPSRSGPGCL